MVQLMKLKDEMNEMKTAQAESNLKEVYSEREINFLKEQIQDQNKPETNFEIEKLKLML